jgi:uncharacterized protein YbaR (Trm112 family)
MTFDDLSRLRCPESRQQLERLPNDRLRELNDAIAEGETLTEDGRPVQRPLDAGLVREDGRYVYPVRDGVPNLLLDDRIPIEE